jgi:hypothetical protein
MAATMVKAIPCNHKIKEDEEEFIVYTDDGLISHTFCVKCKNNLLFENTIFKCCVCESYNFVETTSLHGTKDSSWILQNGSRICSGCQVSDEMYHFLLERDWTSLNLYMWDTYQISIQELPNLSEIHYRDRNLAPFFKYLEKFPEYFAQFRNNQEQQEKSLIDVKLPSIFSMYFPNIPFWRVPIDRTKISLLSEDEVAKAHKDPIVFMQIIKKILK